jgi:sortase A
MSVREGSRGRWLRRTEWLLLAVAATCACYLSGVYVEGASAAEQANHMTAGTHTQTPPQGLSSAHNVKVDPNPSRFAAATVIGKLEIRQIGLSVPILPDYAAKSLLKGVGYVPGTAVPGGLGNVGVAGHRDTYFRPLRNIKPKMDIRMAGPDGVYHYQVDRMEIVTPDQVEVLDTHDRPELTLITCYPFNYIGAAPKRFIVHAHLVSVIPDPN